MTATDGIVLALGLVLAARAGRWLCSSLLARVDRGLDLFERAVTSGTVNAPARTSETPLKDVLLEDDEEAALPAYPATDRLLYEQERRRHDTEGATTHAVCQQWDEQDERLAQEEAEHLSAAFRQLGVDEE